MLREEDKKEIQNRLKPMKDPVNLILFTQKLAGTCQYCVETEQLLKEVSELSNLLKLEILNFVTDKDQVKKYNIDKIPATVIQGEKEYGIRFYGIPTGYEFAAFLDIVLQISSGDSGLAKHLKDQLKEVMKPIHIQVFVTPTCPYCTKAAFTAEQLAIESEKISTSIIEVTEFPQLGQKYGVMGVPKIVLNEQHAFEGAVPEDLFVEHVLNAAKQEGSKKVQP